MATLPSLCSQGILKQPDPKRFMRRHTLPERSMYFLPPAFDVMSKELGQWEPILAECGELPLTQFFTLMNLYFSGAPLEYWKQFHLISPRQNGVWELKTDDVRLIGWFQRQDCFICSHIVPAARTKDHDFYAGYSNEAAYWRSEIDFDIPAFVTGEEIHDVLSL